MDIKEFLTDTLRGAGRILMENQGRILAQSSATRIKDDTSLVTEADLASEKYIISRIGSAFTDDLVMAEESGLSQDREVGRKIWIIDPLDGTTNYANGYPCFCVSIARAHILPEGLKVEVGGIYDPSHDKLYLASVGGGATCNGLTIKVAPERPFDQCFLMTGFYYSKSAELDLAIKRFAAVAQHCQSIRRDGSAALNLAMTAEGIFDGFWERGLQLWDMAAGVLLVTEAGGKIANYDENDLDHYDLEGEGIIAGNARTTAQLAHYVRMFGETHH